MAERGSERPKTPKKRNEVRNYYAVSRCGSVTTSLHSNLLLIIGQEMSSAARADVMIWPGPGTARVEPTLPARAPQGPGALLGAGIVATGAPNQCGARCRHGAASDNVAEGPRPSEGRGSSPRRGTV